LISSMFFQRGLCAADRDVYTEPFQFVVINLHQSCHFKKRTWVLHKGIEVKGVDAFADLVMLDCHCIHALMFGASRTCKSKTVSLVPLLGLPPHGLEASYRKTWNVSRVCQPQPAEHIVIMDRVRTGEFNQPAVYGGSASLIQHQYAAMFVFPTSLPLTGKLSI